MKKINKILLCVNFTEAMEHVTEKAASLAKIFGAEVKVLHVVEYMPNYYYYPYDGNYTVKIRQEIKEKTTHYIDELKKYDVLVDSAPLIREGKAYNEILNTCKKENADFIILGASKKTFFDKFILGVTAEKVVRKASVPVWIVHPEDVDKPIQNILCAYDFSEYSEKALDVSMHLADSLGASLTIVHVIPNKKTYPGMNSEIHVMSWEHESYSESDIFVNQNQSDKVDDIKEHLKEQIKNVLLENVSTTVVVVEGEPDEEIHKICKDENADVLVMGCMGRGAIASMFLGSTTEKILRHAPCSMLTIHEEGVLGENVEASKV